MASILITEPGADDANSYATLEELRFYASTRYPLVEWIDDLSDGEIEAIMIGAARILDGSFIWTGIATYEDQALSWPRSGMYNRNGFLINQDTIPIEIKNAQSELSLQLGLSDLLSDDEAEKKNVKKVKASSVEVEFQDRDKLGSIEAIEWNISQSGPEFAWMRIPDAVRLLLVESWYLRQSASPKKESSFMVF